MEMIGLLLDLLEQISELIGRKENELGRIYPDELTSARTPYVVSLQKELEEYKKTRRDLRAAIERLTTGKD